jgi:hypothetical protein
MLRNEANPRRPVAKEAAVFIKIATMLLTMAIVPYLL